MIKFVCKECNFRLESENEKRKCPYCGKETLMREPDANELLKEE